MKITALMAALIGAALSTAGCDDEPEPLDVEDCGNEIDDDHDGFTDCRDIDCRTSPQCTEQCNDGEDNDGDGLVDCEDPNCADFDGCDEICDNDRDDDGDGLVDCADSDCADAPGCGEVCDNEEDDDGDGLVDCADPECADAPSCGEICDNGEDDDGDGNVDCDDLECDTDPACGELCNGEDDDGDGRIDEAPVDEGLGEPCYEGPADAAGVGACVEGVMGCFGGEVRCLGWVAPLEGELCNGQDDDCDGNVPFAEEDCGPAGVIGDAVRMEVLTAPRDVDVVINLDTTGSMAEELDVVRTSLAAVVPEIRATMPTAELGVSHFEDFPVGPFGGHRDRPFHLSQRVTSVTSVVSAAIEGLTVASGADNPESGIESLYQLATGAGSSWPALPWLSESCLDDTDFDGDGVAGCDDPDCTDHPRCLAWPVEHCDNGVDDDNDEWVDCDDPECADFWRCEEPGVCPADLSPGDRALTLATLADGSDLDAYSFSMRAGGVVVVDIDAHEIGGGIDPMISLFDQREGTRIDRSDNVCGDDGRLKLRTTEAVDLVLEVGASSGGGGFYALHVVVDHVELVASGESCAALEVGAHPFDGEGAFVPGEAVALVSAASLYPRPGGSCLSGCPPVDSPARPYAEAFCNGPSGAATCGDGIPDAAEDCDDGNVRSGDGCDWACRDEALPTCGDGTRDPLEDCDDGNDVAGDGCSPTCWLEPGCGNGWTGADEGCDDGNVRSGDGCSNDCNIEPVCGDGNHVPGEGCDDGNTVAGDGCDGECAVEPGCGNALVDEGEGCDDGNVAPGDGCDADCQVEFVTLSPFDPDEGFDPGLGHGRVGGAGFRQGSLPIVVHVTDATSHDGPDYAEFPVDAHDSVETLAALADIGARVVGVRSGEGAQSTDPAQILFPLGMAVATGAEVPPCAFDGTHPRTTGSCDEGECCTGPGGAGVPALAEGPGCPLVFDVPEDGTGLDEALVAGVTALANHVPFTLRLGARDEAGDDVDARCFVSTLAVVDTMEPLVGCGAVPTLADSDDDGVMDSVEGASPDARVTFELSLVNFDVNDVDGDGNTTEFCGRSGTYGLMVDLLAEGVVVMASQRIEITVR